MTHYIDVRDVAQAHVRALNSRPTAQVGRKRIVISSPSGWPFSQTIAFIAEQRPELKGRLTTTTPPVLPSDVMPIDFGRVEQVLGMKVSDFHTTEQVSLKTRAWFNVADRCLLIIDDSRHGRCARPDRNAMAERWASHQHASRLVHRIVFPIEKLNMVVQSVQFSLVCVNYMNPHNDRHVFAAENL